jgi:hypothetical protein
MTDETDRAFVPDATLALLFPSLMGISTAAGIAGVEGRNQHGGGPGVTGTAQDGIGVLGRGGRLATPGPDVQIQHPSEGVRVSHGPSWPGTFSILLRQTEPGSSIPVGLW